MRQFKATALLQLTTHPKGIRSTYWMHRQGAAVVGVLLQLQCDAAKLLQA